MGFAQLATLRARAISAERAWVIAIEVEFGSKRKPLVDVVAGEDENLVLPGDRCEGGGFAGP